jgi:hypothetical protein
VLGPSSITVLGGEFTARDACRRRHLARDSAR